MNRLPKVREFHSPVWSEPIIMEMGSKGARGILVPETEEEIQAQVGEAGSYIPPKMRRKATPQLPEVAQPQVLRHYLHLSQMCLGMETNIDAEGTATMKYSPKVNEALARLPGMTAIHPCQDEDTVQGILAIIYSLDLFLREISGMDQFTFQPPGGSMATYTHACILRAYHGQRGQDAQRDEIITTIFSHPCNAATPATAGFKVITLMPAQDGYPDFGALQAALCERTAGLMITNPEDTGIYNPRIREFTDAVHAAGGLCFYDQANANGILGITRAKEAGFDACHFNLHKTFASPHGSFGPGCAAYGVREELAKYLPKPVVTYDGQKYHLDYERPDSIGKVREFHGNIPAVLRAYAWIMSLGSEGLLEVARTAVMNNNYLSKMLERIKGTVRYYAPGKYRLEQTRWSWEKLTADTGVSTLDIQRRMVDYGLQSFFMSHHPWIVPEPFTPEFCESYSIDDMEYWAAVLKQISDEAYTNPEIVKTSPHKAPIHLVSYDALDDPAKWAITWRAYLKKKGRSILE
ncbi:MAG: aminomethyl-transferring glycine dehydrogenase subunit GcvPB [Desulfobacterales bacterium]|nr:MAG: aminomethyl-transferring glycine dehydrogenase subunit GcvPB [Desulfobacterales bacterium]